MVYNSSSLGSGARRLARQQDSPRALSLSLSFSHMISPLSIFSILAPSCHDGLVMAPWDGDSLPRTPTGTGFER